MKFKYILFLFALFTGSFLSSGQSLKSPAEFLGYELGSQFTRHHRVVDYFKHVAAVSNNVQLEKYGETNERRELFLGFISSEKNLGSLESIRLDHLKGTGIVEGTSNNNIAITWLSYNVHGNESCSTEAAMLTLYKLITEKKDWLKNSVVIMDPCVNPDGRDRYVNWYNQYKNKNYNTNPDVIEHQEPWPRGRANHYLFDLNRDWLWATQVETQQRLNYYNKWMPHVHVDFHEQGINNPYYFAPAALPYHDIITEWQIDFQTQIGKNHAKYFDKFGWSYFTKESFDLFYPSYGDTYPTFMGAIGMTYEQGGSGAAGLGVLNNLKQELTLKDRLSHHTTTGLSTVEMSSKNAEKLILEYQKYFENASLKYKSFIVRGPSERIEKLKKLLDKHEIEMIQASEKSVKALNFETGLTENLRTNGADWVVSTEQPKGKMVQVLFEANAVLKDSATYDITSWSLPFVYGLKGFASQSSFTKSNVQPKVKMTKARRTDQRPYAFIAPWKAVSDAEFLGDLLEEGLNVRFSKSPFTLEGKSYEAGSLIILRGENPEFQNFENVITEIANRLNKSPDPVYSGFVDQGFDLGSGDKTLINNKNIAVLSGEGTSSYNFGEIWHFFETQLQYPLHVLPAKNLSRIVSSKYDVLILPSGFNASKKDLEKLTEFLSTGGSIVAIGSSLNSFANKEGFQLKKLQLEEEKEEKQNLTPYNEGRRQRLKNSISGSIFKSKVDPTHPLAFGYDHQYYSLKLGSSSYELLKTGSNVAYFSKDISPTAGFTGSEALKKVGNSLLFGVESKGRGKLIYMVDNPLFRSFWENGKLFFANAVFFN